jgi:hypothetical protein
LQKGPLFLPDLREYQKAGVFSDGSGTNAIKKLLDQVPSGYRVAEIKMMGKEPGNDLGEGSCFEYIFDPAYFQWNDIVRWIICEGKGKTNRILSRDRKTLITSRSKNESAILVDSEYVKEHIWSRATRKRRWHDIGFSLCILILAPFISAVYGFKGIRKAMSVIFSAQVWSPYLVATLSRKRNTQGQLMSAQERRRIIDSRFYSFRRYQSILWQELSR